MCALAPNTSAENVAQSALRLDSFTLVEINETNRVLQRPPQAAMRLRQHVRAQFTKHLQGRWLLASDNVERFTGLLQGDRAAPHGSPGRPRSLASSCPAHLPIKQRYNMLLRRQPARPVIRTVLLNSAIQPLPRQMLQHFARLQYSDAAWRSPSSCLEHWRMLKTQENPRHAPRPLKIGPDSRGHVPAIHALLCSQGVDARDKRGHDGDLLMRFRNLDGFRCPQ